MTIHELIRQGNLGEIKNQLKNNATEILVKEGVMELTPLHVAIQVGSIEITELLLGINPGIIDIPDAIGDTALQYAVNREDGAYLVRLLCEKGAAIDRFNKCGETCLYNSIYEAIEDENNDGIKDYNKTKILLGCGANCHVICSGQMLFELIAEKNLSMDWWTLLLDFGAGIYADFSKVNVDVNFLRKMTANQILIGATKEGKPIDRTTPGFEEAHTNEEELKQAINAGNLYNFKALIISTKHLINANSKNLELVAQFTKLIELFERYSIKSMQSTGIDQLVKHFLFDKNKDKIPPDLRAVCETREKQMEQQYLRGGLV